MAARNNGIFPVFAHEIDFTCMMCGDYLTTAVECPDNDLFCLDCIGPYLDIVQTLPDNVEADRPGLLGHIFPVFSATRSRHRFRQEANWSTSVEVTVKNGRDFVGAGTYTCDKNDRHPVLLAAIRNANNVCPMCSTTGPFQLSHATDRALADHPVYCPFLNEYGASCLWSGRFARFKRHTHVFEGDDNNNNNDDDDDDVDEQPSTSAAFLQPANQAASSSGIAGSAAASQTSVASHSGQILDAASSGGSGSMQGDDDEEEEEEEAAPENMEHRSGAGRTSSAASLPRSAGALSRRASQAAAVTASRGSVAAGGSSRGRRRDDEDSDDDLEFDYRAIVGGRVVDFVRTTDRGKKTLTMTVKYKL